MDEKMTGKLNKTWYLLIILVFLCALGLRVYRAADKETLSIDETLSVVYTNYNDYGCTIPLVEHNEWHTGKELKTRLFVGDNDIKGTIKDLASLRESTRDTSHPNLYYSLLKISFFGADTTSVGNIIFRGVALNIILFIFSFFFLFRLALLLFPNKPYLIIATLAIAYLSPALVGSTMYLRPYQLEEALLVIYTYMFVRCLQRTLQRQALVGVKTFFLYGILIGLLMLSGFFLIPYVLLLGAVLLAFIIYTEKGVFNKQVGLLIAIFLLSIVVVFVIYPSFYAGLTDYRGQEALNKLALNDFFINVSYSFLEMLRQIKAYYMGIIASAGFFVLLVWALYTRSKGAKDSSLEKNLPLLLVVCAVIWLSFVFFVAPFKEIRYITPVLPIVSLVFPYLISFFQKKTGVALALVFSAIFLLNGLLTKEVYWSRRLPSETYKQRTEIPLLVGGVFVEWMQPPLAPFFTDERDINFLHNSPSFILEVNKCEEIFVLVHKDLTAEYLDIPNYETIDDIQRGDTGTLYRGYLLKRKKSQ